MATRKKSRSIKSKAAAKQMSRAAMRKAKGGEYYKVKLTDVVVSGVSN